MSKPEFYACCPDCYNSHGDCADGGECPCHKGQPGLRSAANWAATGGWPTDSPGRPATYVEGREAPRREFAQDFGPWEKVADVVRGGSRMVRCCVHGAEVAEARDPGTGLTPWWRLVQTQEHGEAGSLAGAMERASEALARTLEAPQPRNGKAPDLEACARAGYDAYHGGIPRYRWDAPEGDYAVRPDVKEAFRAAARAVLAAAGRGGK